MVERIKTLLTTRQLTPTQFADAIGVGRPIISHILSGRNKPSLEVVQKILAAFPDLSVSWLLSGQGAMLSLSIASTTHSESKTTQIPVVKDQRPKRSVTKPTLFDEDQTSSSSATNSTPVKATLAEPIANPAALPQVPNSSASIAQPTQETASTLLGGLAEPGKAIRRIVIFYQDGTFSAYQPE